VSLCAKFTVCLNEIRYMFCSQREFVQQWKTRLSLPSTAMFSHNKTQPDGDLSQILN
jgi:hypothetical protein